MRRGSASFFGRVLTLLLAAAILSTACTTPVVTQPRSAASGPNLLVVAEMREESSSVWAINPINLADKRLLGTFPHQSGFPIHGIVSPDGGLIAMVLLPAGADRFSGARLMVMAKDGSNQKVLEEGVDYDILPAWSPDGRELAFLKRAGTAGAQGPAEAPPASPPTQVYAIAADGKNRRLLFMDSQSLDLFLVGWHQDGKRLIYRKFTSAGDQLWSYTLQGGQFQALGSLGKAPAYGVRLSPDGNSLVASVRQDAGFDVISQSLDGQNRRVLSSGNLRPSNPLFAPDGRRIAFDVELPQQGAAVGVMEAGAEAVSRLSSPSGGKEVPMAFSPDGEWLLERHIQEGRTRALLLRIRDGTKQYLDTAYWIEPLGWTKG